MNSDEFERLTESLFDDVAAAQEDVKRRDDQYRRRTLVRTTFAAIEGWAYALKQMALDEAKADPTLFSVAELALLREETYQLNDKGRVLTQRSKNLPTVGNLRFAVDMAIKSAFGDTEPLLPEYQQEYRKENDELWQKAKEAQSIRNRIVHPKQADDLIIKDEELQTVNDLFEMMIFLPGIAIIGKALIEYLASLRVIGAINRTNANLTGGIWNNTTSPDETNSDDDGGTYVNNLVPASQPARTNT